jgi:hypothetical protein
VIFLLAHKKLIGNWKYIFESFLKIFNDHQINLFESFILLVNQNFPICNLKSLVLYRKSRPHLQYGTWLEHTCTIYWIPASVSNIGFTDTGFLVFGTLIPIPIPVLRTYKMGTFDQTYYRDRLKKILGNICLIYFVFTCKLAFNLAHIFTKRP